MVISCNLGGGGVFLDVMVINEAHSKPYSILLFPKSFFGPFRINREHKNPYFVSKREQHHA